MKKLLKVSLVAMLVAAPMVASATSALPVAYSDGTSTKPTVTAVADVASTSYVKGAYDVLAEAINEVSTTAAAGQTASDVQTAITNAAGTTANTSLSGSNGVLTVEVDGTHITRDSTTGALTLSGTDVTNLGKAATALQSSDVDQVYDATSTNAQSGVAVASAISGKADSADVGALNNLSNDFTSEQKATVVAAVNAAMAEAKSASSTASAAVTDSDLDTAIQGLDGTTANTSLSESNGVLTVQVDTTHVTRDGSGNLTLSADDIASLGKADTAVQSITTGGANGTINVDGTDVTVKNGLTTSSYVTVHTTWGNDATTDTAQVLTNTAHGS